ncbi:hypothetical protein A5658_06300 [Mycobacterium sp. 1245111.1]|uniref:hypothetical protein n=1 Tax=Mycobacterium sp. 1245111.1 TaxID=1834073 RepID=UPI0007FD2EF0|nr:hypothetical protein [Mycobacterium sp. 1245111.1]OBK36232.1 hypothetical protein A5658_06300 [Mycobacterium sp. 1245111.1]
MTWTFAKFAAAGVLTAIPIAAVGIPAYASEISGGASIVLPAPIPADPPPPPAPPGHHGEYYNPNDYDDYNWYNAGADGGGGGGGGG